MKYGEHFEAQSVPQWRAYNIDYDALKHLLKVNTTRDQVQAVAIPGQIDTALQRFEEQFFNELSNQYDRAELFVASKSDEISRRLHHVRKQVDRLLVRCRNSNGKPMSQKRYDRFAKYDIQITRCGEDIRNLQRFVDAQRVAFYKILKKYKKWTGSKTLGDRFNFEVLGNPKSFTKRDFDPLYSQYNHLLLNLRASSPAGSEPPTPISVSRRPSYQLPTQPAPVTYWNEYDDGSEVENELYTIYVDVDSSFPGSKIVGYVVTHALTPVEIVKSWLSPTHSPEERRPLLTSESYFSENQSTLDMDGDDEAYASSSDFPAGYTAHYATLPSVSDQKLARYKEKLLFQACIGSFAAAFILLLIAAVLVTTGRRRLRIEVDAGAITGIVASLFFAIVGFGCMLYRNDTLSWLHRACVAVTFIAACLLNGMLLVLLVGNSAL